MNNMQSSETIANLCRTCMSSDNNLISLFSVLSLSGKEEALNSILYKCTSIQVCTTDVLPQSICNSCLEKLAICYLYRELCFETQIKLQQLYESHKQLLPYNNIEDQVEDACIISTIVSPTTDLKKSNCNNYKTAKTEFATENSKEYTVVTTQLNLLPNSANPGQNFEENETLEQTCDFEYLDCDNKNSYEESDQGTEYNIEENVLEFICNICSKKCKSKYSLNRHFKTHTHVEELKCHICMKQFTRAADVKRHLITHTGEKPYVCDICKSPFTQSGSLAVHIRHKHKNAEPIKQPPNPYDPHPEKSDKSHLCSTCGTRFRHSSTLKIHLRRHLGVKPYECQICNVRFVSSGRLRSHMRVHTGERPFACRICNKSFAHSTVLSRHLKAHTNVKPYKCSYCPKQFFIPYYLNIHLRKHTGEKPLSCSTCAKTFACPKVLSQHEKIHSSERPYLCMNCGKSFRRAQHLKSHMKLHAT